ncbi:MAG: hypothetical protein ACXWZY_09850 [Gaiellaceae bacterium]
MNRLLVVLALVVVAAAGAIAANLALLDYASRTGDPVGKLTPRANLPAAPTRVLRPVTGTVEHGGGDD